MLISLKKHNIVDITVTMFIILRYSTYKRHTFTW